MQHSTGRPTLEEERRFQRIQEIGCICCYMMGRPGVPCEINHISRGGRRVGKVKFGRHEGHKYTFGLCPWHHRGYAINVSAEILDELVGPSMARSPARFRAMFGSSESLLAYQEALLNGETDPVGGAARG